MGVTAQVSTVLKNNYLDFFMATTTFGIEQNIKNIFSVQALVGYTYSERFNIYEARNLRGGVIDVQLRRYIIPGKQQNLSHAYIAAAFVHRFASYFTDEWYSMNNQTVVIRDVKAKAGYFSFGGIVGYQLSLLKRKLLWDNYIGVCGRIGSGYNKAKRGVVYYQPDNMVFELAYSGIAPKFGTALCIVIR
ncbi:MAG: hypothetical protein NZ519_04405 [Bacteroidia bacterium]|nr:hypothetical protein [Bacteroidia bacterium]